MSEDIQPKFIMQGCRELLKSEPTAILFKKQVETLELAIETNPSLVLDLSKSIIETACKTIMRERNIALKKEWKRDFKQFVSGILTHLKLVPPDYAEGEKTDEGIKELISGFIDAIELASGGLAKVRNNEGIASHGKDAYKPDLEGFYALFTARSCDAIVHFLFDCHKTYPVIDATFLSTKPNEYNPDEPINQRIDDDYEPVEVIGNFYKQSEILFRLDPKAYLELINNYEKQPTIDE